MRASGAASVALALSMIGSLAGARAEEGCQDFKWDVARERTLFASAPTAIAAGIDVARAPRIVPQRAYALTLAPLRAVQFAAAPGKEPPPRSFAGLLAFTPSAAARYRISLDEPVWIDVITAAAKLQPADFQGQRGCAAPHKIVAFDLDGAQPTLVQLSGAAHAQLRLTVTLAPERTR